MPGKSGDGTSSKDAAVLCMALAHDGAVEVLYSGCRPLDLGSTWAL